MMNDREEPKREYESIEICFLEFLVSVKKQSYSNKQIKEFLAKKSTRRLFSD